MQPGLHLIAHAVALIGRSIRLASGGVMAGIILGACALPGQTILREFWLNLPGTTVGDLTYSADYPSRPSGRMLTNLFEAPADWADNYGTRMRGYVLPPASGNYTFWISGDDQCQLFLSVDDSPANKRLVASVQSWTSFREWTKESNQQSSAIRLETGKRYYIEALQKEGGGGDSLSVGWQLPAGILERPIPGARLSPYLIVTNPPGIIAQPADVAVEEGQSASFAVNVTGLEPLCFQWQRDRVDMPGETEARYDLSRVVLTDNGARFRCVISNALGQVVSREAWLSVQPESIAPQVVRVNPPVNGVVTSLTQIEVVFSEPVAGVAAASLRVNGQAATNVTGLAAGPYVFQFSSPPAGLVRLAWWLDPPIQDLSPRANAFAGGEWTCTLDPLAPSPQIILNEFLAANENTNGLKDEDGDLEGWVELFNAGTNRVNLGGWSLTDEANDSGRWEFPPIVLAAGDYLVVFVSGKDRRDSQSPLHTNFKLNPYGEYLGLYQAESPRRAADELKPAYPEQRAAYSYGRDATQAWRYFNQPTPSRANGNSPLTGLAAPVHFSAERGFFGNPFVLWLSTATPGARIRYTTNGSVPTELNGLVYADGINVNRTLMIRAAAFKANYLPSAVATHTYLMNLSAAIRSLPVISVVTDSNHLYGPSGIMGIGGGVYVNGAWQAVNLTDYHNPSQHGLAWERPASIEYIRTEDNGGFQIDCGLRVHSSDWFRPRLQSGSKFSFRLYFRGDYGPARLEFPCFANSPVRAFDQLVLRAGNNDPINPFITDELVRRLFLETGQVGVHGSFVNLYVNGQYRGYYNPTERVDKNFCQSWLGGVPDWDVIAQESEAQDGDAIAWNALRQYFSGQDLRVPQFYQEAGRRLDLTNFVDYLLVNIYANTGDWPHNNWRAARPRAEKSRFRFYIWDAEHAFGLYDSSRVLKNTFQEELAGSSEIPTLFQALQVNPEFRLLFADRIHRHFFNNGALTDGRIVQLHNGLRDPLRSLIPDFRNYIVDSWVTQRRGYFLTFAGNAGVLASANAPVFNPHGGRVASGIKVTLRTNQGDLYYTLEGADPRVPFSGAVSPSARLYTNGQPVQLFETTQIKARSLQGTNWSALTEAIFLVSEPSPAVRISEIMYHPPGGDAFEFIELYNPRGVPVDLSGMSFEGIDYTFPSGSILLPQSAIVLGSDMDPEAFARRYPGVTVYGTFQKHLANSGETLVLKDATNQIVARVSYSDHQGWPVEADGEGYSLELVDPEGDLSDPANWRASSRPGGSPGIYAPAVPSPTVRLNEIMAGASSTKNSSDAATDWVELYNRGSAPADLSGWSLSDEGRAGQYVFPAGTWLQPGEFLVVYCDTNLTGNEFHSGFRLRAEGERMFLYDPAGHRIDAVSWGQQVPHYSLGRIDAPQPSWRLTLPTPGTNNRLATLAAITNLVINEWMPNPAAGEQGWFELFNRDTQWPLGLEGVCVGSSNVQYRLTAKSFIGPGGFLRLWADGETGTDQVPFVLAPRGGMLELSSPEGSLIDRIIYGVQRFGESYGCWPDGGKTRASFVITATPGAPNYQVSTPGPQLNEVLVWNASLAADGSGRKTGWIELYNTNDAAWDLSGSFLATDRGLSNRWRFPEGTVMGAQNYLLIRCDPFRPASTWNEPLLNIGAALNPHGGRLYLLNAEDHLMDFLEYGPQAVDLSLGRWYGTWQLLSVPTPGAANAGPAAMRDSSNLKINEWMTHPLEGGDWFEIHNPNSEPVSLSNISLTDDPSLAGTRKYVVGALSYIGGYSWLVWRADGDASGTPGHVNFRLDQQGETLRMYNSMGARIDSVDSGPQTTGGSVGRWPDGQSNIVTFPTTPTPGEANQLDTDGDGMPDDWEVAHQLAPQRPDGDLDADGDGLTNLEEYRCGTDPQAPHSVLRIERLEYADDQVRLGFQVTAGRAYVLVYRGSLTSGIWTQAAKLDTQPSTQSAEMVIDRPSPAEQGFYQVLMIRSP